jgi:hypothetical protein
MIEWDGMVEGLSRGTILWAGSFPSLDLGRLTSRPPSQIPLALKESPILRVKWSTAKDSRSQTVRAHHDEIPTIRDTIDFGVTTSTVFLMRATRPIGTWHI